MVYNTTRYDMEESVVERDEDQLLTVPEVSECLRIDPQSTRRWLRETNMPGISLGQGAGWRIRRADLAQFLADRYTTRRWHLILVVLHG